MLQMNNSLNDSVESLFFIASDQYKSITSLLVREVIDANGDFSKFVSKDIYSYIRK